MVDPGDEAERLPGAGSRHHEDGTERRFDGEALLGKRVEIHARNLDRSRLLLDKLHYLLRSTSLIASSGKPDSSVNAYAANTCDASSTPQWRKLRAENRRSSSARPFGSRTLSMLIL